MNALGILSRIRADIRAMKPYASARSMIAAGDDPILLDANEMPFAPLVGTEGYNRYMPQQPPELLAALADFYGMPPAQILATRGADEAIEVLTRLFCQPGNDSIVYCPPTFPMYALAARLNGTDALVAPLDENFSVDMQKILATVRDDTKLVFLCSPNNPTGESVDQKTIASLCATLAGKALVVVDEAYGEFSTQPSALPLLARHDNLAILRTLSKSMALAGVRCGVLITGEDLIEESRKILAPYPLAVPAVEVILKTLAPENRVRLAARRAEILAVKDWFTAQLAALPEIEKLFPSDANFVLARVKDAARLYERCRERGLIVRNQSHQPGLANCLRFSIGSREQMEDLVHVLKTGERVPRKTTRSARIVRKTKETAIDVAINLDEAEPIHIRTGIGFYDHMLEQIARHGGFSMEILAAGDLEVDAHHTIEDVAIALGQALRQALGDKRGIERYGFTLPMDEAAASVTLDLSGRAFFKFEGHFPDRAVGGMPTDMVGHVFRSLAENLQATVHLSVLGENTHHMVEACFKALGRALKQAVRQTGDATLPSSKGVL
jgi:histidinol-phosphate aminotransferase/imidazoleglycerol-phosphate dehydratase/histidinol-phosphatase